jgi:Uma2 family endonuclease
MQEQTRGAGPFSKRKRRRTRVRLANMPPIKPDKKFATYDDVLAAPEHKVAEIIDGDLYLSPRPAFPHAVAESQLGGILIPTFGDGRGGPGRWRIVLEPELHLGPDIVVPDLAGWRRERLPSVPNAAFLTIAPDWLCEVLSPSTEPLDRAKKARIYARKGVSHMWLINPITRTIEISRLESGRWMHVDTHLNDEIVQAEPFEAVPLELSRLWS